MFFQKLMKTFSFQRKDCINGKLSYSQCGEDLIMNFIFQNYLKIQHPKYIDIGAHHPSYLSNTYFFYQKGSNGVCIEPDPFLFKTIKKSRKRDVCLNCGVGTGSEKLSDFYRMSEKTLNTFSKEDAERYESYGNHKIEEIVQIPLISTDDIIEKHCTDPPNLVSLDVEGFDFEILKSFNFEKYRPNVFCIETLTYVQDNTEQKIHRTIDFMQQNNYFVYADTYINTIFVDKISWDHRL